MLTKFSEGIGGGLADRYLKELLTPALFFWLGGLLAWISRFGLDELERWWAAREVVEQAGILIGALLLVLASSALVQRLQFPVLRALEGYWPDWLDSIRKRLISRQLRHYQELEDRWQTVATRELGELSPLRRREYVRLDQTLRYYPDPNDLMPSALGNRLRAAETWPRLKYGLDTIITWPRLWLVLPDGVRTEIGEARRELDGDVLLIIWSVVFLIWSIWNAWALIVAVAVMLFAYRSAVQSAEIYGVFVEAAYDVFRLKLYS